MRISPEVEIALEVAQTDAARRQHEYWTLEHLLYALLMDETTMEVVRATGGNIASLKEELEQFLSDPNLRLSDEMAVTPNPSMGVQRVLRRALAHVQGAGKEEVTGPQVLIAMYAEAESPAVAILENSGITRLDVVAFVSHGVSKREDADEEDDDGETLGPKGGGGAKKKSDPLEEFCSNLNVLAQEKKIDPLIGRDREIDRVVQILARRKKNNPILVGDSGVGKTAIAEGLAHRIVAGEVPKALSESVVYSLDMGALMAGTRYRGDFEERMKGIMKSLAKLPHAILFIDEIHNLVGLGATSGGSSVNAANLLKPALANGRLRCMGSTTFDEYRQNFEKDKALARRFQKVDVGEPSVEDTVKILEGLRPKYEEFHGVTYEPEAIRAAADLSAKYLQDRKLPDKAIDLMDEAGAHVKLRMKDGEKGVVRELEIETVLAKMAQIPPKVVSTNDKERLRNLDTELGGVVFGQQAAIVQLTSAIKLARSGLRSAEKPIGSFLLSGPTGVGKTEVAKQLARIMGVQFIRFDMSEYMERHAVSRLIGAPPGYVGFDQGGLLTDAIAKTPHAVLLLDEIEKAHPDVFNVLLQVMDHGKLTDNNGKASDFRHVILLMTSNVGARDLTRRAVGFGDKRAEGDADREYKRMFSPEFRNRLDARIEFDPLSRETMKSIVEKFIWELEGQLVDKNVTIDVTDAARTYLGDKGYDPDYGARPLGRVIQEEVKRPLSEEILFGKLEGGGKAIIDSDGKKLEFRYEPSVPRDEKPADEKPKGDKLVN